MMNKIFISRKRSYVGDGLPIFYVGRPSPLGNPFPAAEFGLTRCLELYKAHLEEKANQDKTIMAHIRLIRNGLLNSDIVLLCWCRCDFNPKKSDHACHADIIREFLMR